MEQPVVFLPRGKAGKRRGQRGNGSVIPFLLRRIRLIETAPIDEAVLLLHAVQRPHIGELVAQPQHSDSDIIRQITQGDYWQMFYTQMLERQAFHYPPFQRLIYVYLRHKDDELLEHLADDMADKLRKVFGERVLGPDRPPVARIHSLYIRKIMLKIEPRTSTDKVRQHLIAIQQQMLAMPIAKNLNIYYDVDPL